MAEPHNQLMNALNKTRRIIVEYIGVAIILVVLLSSIIIIYYYKRIPKFMPRDRYISRNDTFEN